MRESFFNVVTDAEACNLRSNRNYVSFKDSRLSGILKVVRSTCNASTSSPAYARVECKKEGHPWHTDVGNMGHMSWCRFSARVLLTPEDKFTGGQFYFKDAPDAPIYGYKQLWIYDPLPENDHFVASHKGQRSVLLMFFT